MRGIAFWLALLLLLPGCSGVDTKMARHELSGTAWQLVRYDASTGKTLTPDHKFKYIVAFGGDGSMSVRLDCNRGGASWHAPGPGQIRLGRLWLTRDVCAPGSLHDQIVGHWPSVRSYTMRDGDLLLSLTAEGGTYRFEPLQ